MNKKSWDEIVIFPAIIALITGVVVGIATFCANDKYDENKTEQNKIEGIKNLSMGVSEKYLDEKIGTPIYSLVEEASGYSKEVVGEYLENKEKIELKHNFYKLDENLIRITFDQNKVVAFFFFQLENEGSIDLDFFSVSKINLGKDSYEQIKIKSESEFKSLINEKEIDREASIIKIDNGNDNANLYYSEWYQFGKTTSYSTVVYGNIYNKNDIGRDDFENKNLSRSTKLILDDKLNDIGVRTDKFNLVLFDQPNTSGASDISKKIHSDYSDVKPNIYGIVKSKYNQYIEIDSPSQEWHNIYYGH